MLVQNFLAVLATPEHPLVVFLDDLQWADAATLQLLLPLLANPDLRSVFVIGAYRDNEVLVITQNFVVFERSGRLQLRHTRCSSRARAFAIPASHLWPD